MGVCSIIPLVPIRFILSHNLHCKRQIELLLSAGGATVFVFSKVCCQENRLRTSGLKDTFIFDKAKGLHPILFIYDIV